VAIASLFFLVFFLFGNTVTHHFNSDDYIVLYNALLHSAGTPVSTLEEFLTPSWGLYYRPIAKIFLESLVGMFGLRPAGYHLISLICYAVLCFEVYYIGLLLTHKWLWALASAIIFLAASAHAEALFWISGLNGVLENILSLASLLFFIRWRQVHSLRSYLCSLAFFAFALLTKESSVSLPIIICSYDLLLGGELRWPIAVKRVARSCLPFVVLGISFMVVRHAVMRQVHLPLALTAFDWKILVVGLWYLLIMTLSPIDWALSLHWFDKLAASHTAFPLLGGIAILAVAIVPVLMKRFRLTFLLWWILASAAPVLALGLVPSERHAVLGSAAAAILVSIALFKLSERLTRRSYSVVLGCAFAVIFAGTSCYFLKQRQAIWGHASEITNGVVNQTMRLCPAPSPGTTFFFLNVPDSAEGALIFRFETLTYALRLLYRDDSIEVVRIATIDTVPHDALSSATAAYFRISAMGGHVYLPESGAGEQTATEVRRRIEQLGILREDKRYIEKWEQYGTSPLLEYYRGELHLTGTEKLRKILEELHSLV